MMEKGSPDSEALVYESCGLTKSFDGGSVAALRGVDFHVREGEFVAVIGPSGCGKTRFSVARLPGQPSEGTLDLSWTVHSRTCRILPLIAPGKSGLFFSRFTFFRPSPWLRTSRFPCLREDCPEANARTGPLELFKTLGLEHRLEALSLRTVRRRTTTRRHRPQPRQSPLRPACR